MSCTAAYEKAHLRLYFEPDEHPENMFTAFQEFIQYFQLPYDAMYLDPLKVSLEVAMELWKITAATLENESSKPLLEQLDKIFEQKNHVIKVRSS